MILTPVPSVVGHNGDCTFKITEKASRPLTVVKTAFSEVKFNCGKGHAEVCVGEN